MEKELNKLDELLANYKLKTSKNKLKAENIKQFNEKFQIIMDELIIPKMYNISARIKKNDFIMLNSEIDKEPNYIKPHISYTIRIYTQNAIKIVFIGDFKLNQIHISTAFSKKDIEFKTNSYDVDNFTEDMIENEIFNCFTKVL